MSKISYYFFKAKYINVVLLLALVTTGFRCYPVSKTLDVKLPDIKHTPYIEPSISTYDTFNWKAKNKKAETLCLAKNIYFEGRGESLKGQAAIGLVTINRVKNKSFPNSICKVVFQKGKNRRNKLVAQFSWTLDGNSNYPKTKTLWWKKIYRLAQAMTADGVLSNFHDFTGGSLYYHAKYIDPNWHNLNFKMDIENHRFYTT